MADRGSGPEVGPGSAAKRPSNEGALAKVAGEGSVPILSARVGRTSPPSYALPAFAMVGHGQAQATGKALVVGGVVAGVLGTLLWERLTSDPDLELLRDVRELAAESYIRPIEEGELVDDALRGMVGGLDRYSHYYGAAELTQLNRETSGEFRGLGVVFRKPMDGQILFPLPGGPADRAGIKVGDRIVAVDGRAVAEVEGGNIQQYVQSSGTDSVNLRVAGLEGDEREFEVRLETLVDPTVRHARMLDAQHGIGYLVVTSFSHKTLSEFDSAIQDLSGRGLRSLVIDLRGNPGGILDAAVHIANRFVMEGTLVATCARDEIRRSDAAPQEARLFGMPLVVIVDGDSASASEVLAGALQDHGAAVILGETTYGKGTVQTLSAFGERGVAKITTAVYMTPSGRQIEPHHEEDGSGGLAPDVELLISEQERRAVHEYLSTYSVPESVLPEIRAWESQEGASFLPVHPADAQLDTALRLLAGESLAEVER